MVDSFAAQSHGLRHPKCSVFSQTRNGVEEVCKWCARSAHRGLRRDPRLPNNEIDLGGLPPANPVLGGCIRSPSEPAAAQRNPILEDSECYLEANGTTHATLTAQKRGSSR